MLKSLPASGGFQRWFTPFICGLALLVGGALAQTASAQDAANDEKEAPSEESFNFDQEFWQELRDVLKLLALTDEQQEAIEQILLENQEARIAARQALALALFNLETWDGNIETEAALHAEMALAFTNTSILYRDTWNAIWEVLTLQQKITFSALEVLVRNQITLLWEAYEPPTPDQRRERRAQAREAYLARMDAFREFIGETYPDFAEVLDILRGFIEESPKVQALKERIDGARLTDEQKDAIHAIFTEYQPLVQEVRETVLLQCVSLYDGIMDSADDATLATTSEALALAMIDQRLVQLEIIDQILLVLTEEQLALIVAWREWWDTRRESRPLGEGWRVGRLGLYNDANAPWVYQAYLGWLYVNTLDQMEGASEGVWIYQRRTGEWFYTLENLMPYFYSAAQQAWLYLEEGWFYNFDTEAWEPAG